MVNRFAYTGVNRLKVTVVVKKNFFIPSIDRECCSDAQIKKKDILHDSVRR